jgi:hypothetical protein
MSNRTNKDEKAKKRNKGYFVNEAIIAVHHAITIAHSGLQSHLKTNIPEEY